MKVFGHRGYSAKFPENSILAFMKAFEFGADGVELDVREVKDGKVVVFHDEDLKRIFGDDRKVEDIRMEDLEKMSYSGQKTPKLEEVLKIIPAGKWVIVEIKERRAAEDAIDIVKRQNLEDRVIFSSFDHDLIEDLMKKHPDLKFAYLIGERHADEDPKRLIERFLRTKPHSVHIPLDAFKMFPEMVRSMVKVLRENGIEIFVWNINDVRSYEEIKDLIDAVITDEVEDFVSARDENKS